MGGKPNRKVIEIVRRFKSQESRKYGIEKVILFGSQARGTQKKNSDIDLIIVVRNKIKDRPGFMTSLIKEWHSVHKINKPVDFLPYSVKEFNKLARGTTIVSQALSEGVVV
jgi:predicted nucleotidyltransferase